MCYSANGQCDVSLCMTVIGEAGHCDVSNSQVSKHVSVREMLLTVKSVNVKSVDGTSCYHRKVRSDCVSNDRQSQGSYEQCQVKVDVSSRDVSS